MLEEKSSKIKSNTVTFVFIRNTVEIKNDKRNTIAAVESIMADHFMADASNRPVRHAAQNPILSNNF